MYWFDSVEVAFTRSVIPEPLAEGLKIPFSIVLRFRSAFSYFLKGPRFWNGCRNTVGKLVSVFQKCLQILSMESDTPEEHIVGIGHSLIKL